jgi:FO synthase
MEWPEIAALRSVTADAGFTLRERLAVYPEYLREPGWVPDAVRQRALEWTSEAGLVRKEQEAA